MRLLILSNHYPPHSLGSYELQCYQVCNELSNRGHQVRVLTSKRPHDAPNPHPESTVFRELELYEDPPRDNLPFHRLFRTVRANQKVLESHLANFLPAAVMIWGMDRLSVSLLEMAEASAIPCLYGVYDFWLSDARTHDCWWNYWNCEDATDTSVIRPFLRALHLDKFAVKQAPHGGLDVLALNHIYFCSESLKQESAKACGRSFDGARVIPCAISPGEIRPRIGQQTGQDCHLVYVARLTEEKDPMTAIRAIQELRHRGDERFSLDIYGRGESKFESALHDYVRRFQLGGAINFKPMIEEQVRNSIHLYDGLVFTSTYPEPFPLVHLKAMAARVPVISTLNGGSGELIRDGENGLSFPAGNHHSLADKITLLADNPDLVQKMTATAHSELTHHYTLARITSRIETLLYQATHSGDLLEQEAV